MRSEVQIFPGPPFPAFSFRCRTCGAIAQLGERLLCKQEVVGSIPSGSTIFLNDGSDAIMTTDERIVRLMKYSVPVRGENRNGEIFYIVKRQITRTSVRVPARECETDVV